jgi:hypothetical protein
MVEVCELSKLELLLLVEDYSVKQHVLYEKDFA